eukprot:GHVL01021566.1.p1 GENE.GHVL01021566.1~~GHVL01021566.1.p1  ORF type:complete len:366 (+),score=71.27 GHVL01021566.1:310-1407(+)
MIYILVSEEVTQHMTPLKIFCLLSAFFLGIGLPYQNTRVPPFSFKEFFSDYPSQIAKVECLIAYFDSISDRIHETEKLNRDSREINELNRDIILKRLYQRDKISLNDLKFCQKKLCKITIKGDKEMIENSMGIQADFANKYLGGGVLTRGCVQEEIRMLLSPELLIARILFSPLGDRDAALISGTEKFSICQGYSRSFRFIDKCADETPVHEECSLVLKKSCIVAFDAEVFKHEPHLQYRKYKIERELNKLTASWRFEDPYPCLFDERWPIATGNWGCGAFGGDHELKAVIQWIAASYVGRDLDYHTFGDAKIANFGDFLSNNKFKTIGDIIQKMMKTQPKENVFACLLAEHTPPNLLEYACILF